MRQIEFAHRAKEILETDADIIGLAVGGSWISDQMDAFSDLDLIIVTKDKVSDRKDKMMAYAKRLGKLLSGFTGEHLGEPRLLICLYDQPLLHVDIKFVTTGEFGHRIETPVILFDRAGRLQSLLESSLPVFPYPDYQWIEDRFWTWIHYALLKVGRGEYFEALDFLSFLRVTVLGPLLHIKYGNLPRGVRKVEKELDSTALEMLQQTVPVYEKHSILASLKNAVDLYKELSAELFNNAIQPQTQTQQRVMLYFGEIENK